MARGYRALRHVLKRNKKFRHVPIRRFNKAAEGAPYVRGIVTEKITVEARQPSSGERKCVRVKLLKNDRIVRAFCPGDQAITYVNEHDTVLLAGAGGRLGRSRGDCCGVSYKVIKVAGVSLKQLVAQKKTR